MKTTHILAIIATAAIVLSACGQEAPAAKEPTITTSNNPDVIFIDGFPFSRSFQIESMEAQRPFKDNELFEYTNYSVGEDGEHFNYSIAKPRDWTMTVMQKKLSIIEGGKNSIGILMIDGENEYFTNYTNCSDFVSSLYGEKSQLSMNGNKTVTVNGNEFDRVYYELATEKGLEQCMKTEESLMVVYGFLNKETKNPITYEELEKIFDDFYLVKLGEF